jgi:hypothetical protein
MRFDETAENASCNLLVAAASKLQKIEEVPFTHPEGD